MPFTKQKRVEQEENKTSGLRNKRKKPRRVPESNSDSPDFNVGADHSNTSETLLQGEKITYLKWELAHTFPYLVDLVFSLQFKRSHNA